MGKCSFPTEDYQTLWSHIEFLPMNALNVRSNLGCHFPLYCKLFWESLSFDEILLTAITVIVFSMLVILGHFEKPKKN